MILLTGATSGFGKTASAMLAARGHRVFGTGRTVQEGQREDGVWMLRMDVTDVESVHMAVDAVMRIAGRIDVLVNNAGAGIGGALELATQEEKHWQMDTNFMGMTNVCSYSQALAVEVRRFGIDVCVVEPGDFRTGFTSSRRVSEATLSHPDYAGSFRRTLAGVEKDETHGSSPEKLGRVICRLVEKRRPGFRTLTGSLLQTMFARVSRILPGRLVQKLLAWFYSV